MNDKATLALNGPKVTLSVTKPVHVTLVSLTKTKTLDLSKSTRIKVAA